MQNEVIFLIEKLLNYYNLTSLQELAEKLNIKQSSLSSWKSRNSINAIRNKCRELGIYNEIFGDLNSKSQYIGSITNSNISQNKLESQQIKEICNTSEIIKTDEATFSLYREAYLKAKKNGKIKEFRIYLMECDL